MADIRIKKGAPSIKSENARRNAWVYVDITGVDVGTYVQKVLSVPFALTGGLWLMDWMGYNMSVAVAVGFMRWLASLRKQGW